MHEFAQDRGRIGVMHAALVVLARAALGFLRDRVEQGLRIGRAQRTAQFFVAAFDALPQQCGKELGAIHLRVLVRQRLAPDRAKRLGARFVETTAIVGAGQLQGKAVGVVQQREIQAATLDREAMPPQRERFAARAQLVAVAQVAQTGFLEPAQAAGEFVRGDGLADAAQLLDLALGTFDQAVAGKERVQFLGRRNACNATRHTIEHARDGFLDALRAALALPGDLFAPRGERFQCGLAARGQLDDEVGLLAETRFELLDLAEHLGQRRIYAFRRIATAEQVQHRLFQHGELRAEFESLLLHEQTVAARAQCRADPVDLGVELRGLAKQRRTLLCIALVEAGDQARQTIERLRQRIEFLGDRRQRNRRACLLHRRGTVGQALTQTGERGRVGEEFQCTRADPVQFLTQLRIQRRNRRGVDMRLLAHDGEFAALALEQADRVGEIVRLLPQQARDARQQFTDTAARADDELRRFGLGAFELLIGVQRLASAAREQRDFAADVADLCFSQPRIRVAAACRDAQQALVGAAAADVFGEASQLAQLGQGAHHTRVAEASEQACDTRLRAGVLLERERRAP